MQRTLEVRRTKGLEGAVKISPWAGALLALLLAVFAVAPLAYPGFFESHSGFVASFRVQHLPAGGLFDASDPVRGEGSLAYYVAWPFLQLAGSGVTAIKWGYALSFLLGALALYAWARLRLGTQGGVLAAAVYTYLPWHLATVYVRGAYAEAWLWALWPAALWAWEVPLGRGRWLLRLAGLALAAAAFVVQPGLTFLLFVLLVPYAVAVWRVRWWPARLAAVAAAAGLLVGGAWIASGVAGENAPAATGGFLYPYQLLSAAWTQDLAGGALPYQLGVAAVALSIVSLGLWAVDRSESASSPVPSERPARRGVPRAGTPTRGYATANARRAGLYAAMGFWAAALAVTLLLTLHFSAPLWSWLRLGSLVPYPWQLLVLSGLPLAFLAGAAARLDRRLAGRPLWAGMAALAVLASYAYLAPRFTQVDPGAGPVAEFQPLAQAEPSIHLLDAEMTPAAEITSTLTLTLTWQALAPVGTDYTVFVHLLSGDNKLTQADSWPCSGACPTHDWRPGQVVVDVHDITIPPGAPAGPYRVALGLYQGATGERVAVAGRDDGTVYLDVR